MKGASHCLNMVFIRALRCPLMPKQGQIIDRSSIYHRYIFDISIVTDRSSVLGAKALSHPTSSISRSRRGSFRQLPAFLVGWIAGVILARLPNTKLSHASDPRGVGGFFHDCFWFVSFFVACHCLSCHIHIHVAMPNHNVMICFWMLLHSLYRSTPWGEYHRPKFL